MRDEQVPLVSVVLATYNSDERYLVAAVAEFVKVDEASGC